MFLTLEELKKYQPCNNGWRYMSRFHPNGFDMTELVMDRHIPREFIHWAKEFLPCSEEEKKLYLIRMNIDQNSSEYYHSHDLIDSHYIKHSHKITKSSNVFYGEDVYESKDVVKCIDVDKSSRVFESQIVSESNLIYFSSNVTKSFNVVKSSVVANSKNIINGFNVFESSEIINGKNLTACHFCSECENLTHCLFCNNLTDKEYHIFNLPVSKERYLFFIEQYKKWSEGLYVEFCAYWPPENLLVFQTPKIFTHKALYYYKTEKRMWNWAKTLPGYNEQLLYEMTLLPEVLVF